MLRFILETKIKYAMIGVTAFFFFTCYLTQHGVTEEEQQILDSLSARRVRMKSPEDKTEGRKIVDLISSNNDLKYYSGKEASKLIDLDKRAFKLHKIQIVNSSLRKAIVVCKDPFSTFSKTIAGGGLFEFMVTDLFSKRHYWCDAKIGQSFYRFKAYGEGMPRADNVITLTKSGVYFKNKPISESTVSKNNP